MRIDPFWLPRRAPDVATGGGAAADQANGAGGAAAAATAAGGGGAPDWTAGLDDAGKQLLQVKGWKSPAEALRGYSELERVVGSDKIVLPGKDAKPEDWGPVYDKLGRPAAADKYEVKAPEGRDWTPEDKAFQAQILPGLHAAGVTQRQLEAILPAWEKITGDQRQAFEGAPERVAAATTESLTKEWGGEAAYKTNVGLANGALRTVFGAEGVKAVTQLRLADGSFVLDQPLIVKAFAQLGKRMAEDGALEGGAEGGTAFAGGDPKTELDKIYAEAKGNPKHPYVDPKHPEHKAMLDKVMRLTMATAGEG